jgi:hypothetical protein
MELECRGELWFWKGPSPFHFVTIPDEVCAAIEHAAAIVTYGWGMVPVTAQIGRTSWTTALWPKDERYILGVKAAVRKAEGIDVGDEVTVRLTIDV